MNAAELQAMKKMKSHAPETPRCTGVVCWCGLCHCTGCQQGRQNAAPRRGEKENKKCPAK